MDHPFAIFRFTPDAPMDTVFEDSLLVAVRRFAARRPGLAWPQTYLGGQLVDMHRFAEALAPLAEAARLAPNDPLVARFQAVAAFETGDLEGAAEAAARASRLTGGESWEEGYLGHVRLAQGRFAEARDHLARATREAPGAGRYVADYLRACAGAQDWKTAATAAQQVLRAAPSDATARLVGARAWLALGEPDRARAIVALPGPATGEDAAAYLALADSLRRTAGGPHR